MKQKIATFFIGSIIYGLIYFIILCFVGNDYTQESKYLQILFFGIVMFFLKLYLGLL